MAVIGKKKGVVKDVIDKLESISKRIGKDVEIHSGKRSGDINKSAHNSGIAVDIKISGMKSIAIADELVLAGFSGVGEYYSKKDYSSETNTAHGDIRGLVGSENSGAYGPGGSKSAKLCWSAIPKNDVVDDSWDYTYGSRHSGNSCP